MSEQTGYDEKHIRECSKELCIVLNYAKTKPNYQAVYKKFSLPKFMEVAKISIGGENNANSTTST